MLYTYFSFLKANEKNQNSYVNLNVGYALKYRSTASFKNLALFGV